jgi:hypothetical protein
MAGDWEFCELWEKDKLVAEVKKCHRGINNLSHKVSMAHVAIRKLLHVMGVKNIAHGYEGTDHTAAVDSALKAIGHKFKVLDHD